MGSLGKGNALSVELKGTYDRSDDNSGSKEVRASYNQTYSREVLGISFRHTIRVPDNDNAYQLPPDCGEKYPGWVI